MDYAPSCGVGFILGRYLMMTAGIRPGFFNATAKLPDEIAINLLRPESEVDDTAYGVEIAGGPASSLDVESRF